MRKLTTIAVATLLGGGVAAAQEGRLTISGTTYTKWLYSTIGQEGAMYNFTTAPGESSGHNGQGTELELLLGAKISREVEVKGRIHSRFNQNFWTNFGGFGGSYDGTKGPDQCTGGSCGEYDPRSNQYVKLRGMTVLLTPGYRWLDSASIGSSDLGMFDPLVVGKIRYIDRDNASGVLLQGSAMRRALTWDAMRISLPRLWAGPGFNTGSWTSTDAAYTLQGKVAPTRLWDVTGLFNYVNDSELNPNDKNVDNGTSHRERYGNAVGALKLGAHLGPWADLNVKGYYSWSKTYDNFVNPSFGSVNGYGPVPLGELQDFSVIADWVLNDPFGIGLNINIQGFSIGAKYASIMAARRESDVLLTEGHDATWAFPGPSNAKYGVFGGAGNKTAIGYGGWSGTAQQVATVNVDNEFTDFDEPMAETVIGWRGVTVNPVWSVGPLELAGEYTLIGYDTNWQAWGDSARGITDTPYPGAETPSGVGSFRAAYQPFQDKLTQIAVVRAKYTIDAVGVDVFGKAKLIHETDDRMTDANFLPYEADGTTVHNYSPGHSTSAIFGNPTTAGQWKPFDSLADDDRKMTYWAFNAGLGKQLTDRFYVSLAYAKYLVDLKDGNTALQGFNLMEMASGKHDKNQIILKAKYNLAGVEFGGEGQYSFGTFKPDFGGGYTPQTADATVSGNFGVPIGSPGFSGRFGGWNSLLKRDFEEFRMKVFMKAQF